jgi:membrane-bound lytic murein transglycosylase D
MYLISIVGVLSLSSLDAGDVGMSAHAGLVDAGNALMTSSDQVLDSGWLAPAPLAVDAGWPIDAGTAVLAAQDAQDEIEELRALENEVLAPAPKADVAARNVAAQMGLHSFALDNLEATLDSFALDADDLEFQLAQVTDLNAFDVSTVKNQYDIPVEMKPLVAQYIRFFTGPGRKWFRRWMSRSSRYIPLMQPILEARGLPRDLVYLSMIESGFNTKAESWAAAVGPWQFIPGTAKIYKLKEDYWIDERQDPIKATHAAATFLSELHHNFGHWYLAWAGYNSGGGRVRKMIKKYELNDFWVLSEKRGFAEETIHYVPKLIACALVAKNSKAFGFEPEEFVPEGPFEFEEVTLTQSVDMDVLANAAQCDVSELSMLNPELKRWCTPPADEEHPYVLRIPKNKRDVFVENFAKLPPEEKLSLTIHVVKRGDTLSKIALKYHSVPEAIMRMNQLSSAKMLRLDSQLMVPVPRAKEGDVSFERQVQLAKQSGIKALRADEEVPAGPSKTKKPGTPTAAAVVGPKLVTYKVVKGDSLWGIARKFDVHVADVREWNDSLASSRGLKVGTNLKIYPGERADVSSATSVSAASPSAVAAVVKKPVADVAPVAKVETKVAAVSANGMHTVSTGDSLWSIARQYETTVANLKTLNNLESNKLKLGRVLKVSAK